MMIYLANEQESEEVAQKLALCLVAPLVMTFSGDIGVGKTTFIRALLRALGVSGVIKSPSYSLLETYQGNDILIHHFDLYRIKDEAELDFIGFREYLHEQALCCIEWPEHAPSYLCTPDFALQLVMKEPGREMSVRTHTTHAKNILDCFKRHL